MDKDPVLKTSTQENPQNELREALLSGNISPSVFLQKIQDLDQLYLDRRGAPANLKLLLDPEVQRYFSEGDLASNYQLKLSLTYFHIGQGSAFNESADAIEYFEKALEAFRKVEWEDDRDDPYCEATIAYLKKDIDGLRNALPKINDDKNKPIVLKFLKRLESGGEPNYRADYFNIT